MSLINTMLRDLDARQAAAVETPMPAVVRSPREPKPARRSLSVLYGSLALLLIAALLAGLLWYAQDDRLALLNAHRATPAAQTPRPTVLAQQLAPPSQPAPAPRPDAAASPPIGTLPSAAFSSAPPVSPPPPPAQHDGLKRESALAQLPGPRPLPPQKREAVASKTAPQIEPRIAPHITPNIAPKHAPASREPIAIEKREPIPIARDAAELEYRKGIAAFKVGHMSDAIAQFKLALRADAHHVAARQSLLGVFVDQKQWDEASALLGAGLEIMPMNVSWAMALARIQVERGHAAEASDTLQKYMVFGQQNAEYRGFAGVLLQRLEKPREAMVQYQAAVELKPTDARWWLGLGIALESDGRIDEARNAFLRARGAEGLTPEMLALIERKLR